MKSYDVAVVYGGPSPEAAVSRVSAEAVFAALRETSHRPQLIALDANFVQNLTASHFDVVFPVAHGGLGEDGGLQGILEWLRIPYVGSRVLASALAMDKAVARLLFAASGLPIAAGLVARNAEELHAQDLTLLGPKLVVKPSAGGSAVGVTRIETEAPELRARVEAACSELWRQGSHALIERWAVGAEVTCAVLDVPGPGDASHAWPTAFAPIEIETPEDAFYTFTARYARGRSLHHCPARLPAETLSRIQTIARMAHRALGCRHLSRVDFIVPPAGDPVLLEVNTLPGFTKTSLFPEAALHSGLPFSELCSVLIHAAITEGLQPLPEVAPFPPILDR
jgi:D-alanine-D-alanine ligase